MKFNTSTDEAFAYAAQRMQLENPTRWPEPVHITDRLDGVPKVCIHTLKDNCCSYYPQRVMVKQQPCVAQYYLDTDHVDMMSDAEKTNEISSLSQVSNQNAAHETDTSAARSLANHRRSRFFGSSLLPVRGRARQKLSVSPRFMGAAPQKSLPF